MTQATATRRAILRRVRFGYCRAAIEREFGAELVRRTLRDETNRRARRNWARKHGS